MSVIVILIACSLLLAAGFLAAFMWAARSGQFEDDYTPSVRMLFEDDKPVQDFRPEREAKSETINHKPNDPCQKT